ACLCGAGGGLRRVRMEAETVTPSKRRQRLRRVRECHPVWALNVPVLVVAALLFLGPVQGLRPLAHPHIEWWLVALAFIVAERCVVHLHFHRGAHSFSLADIPLVFGLIFSSGEGVVIGCL